MEGDGRDGEAQASFCRAYTATGAEQSEAHARQFLQDGIDALSRPEGGDLRLAESYFTMAHCIAPEQPDVAEALTVVRDALATAALRAGGGHDEL